VRAAWCLWTSDPVDQPGWTDANPASGQCASTALVVQDRLGGELLMAEVHEPDGSRQGVHYWNRLPDGRELDLTREQFQRGEVVGPARVVGRPPDVTRGRLAGNYHLLAHRVTRALDVGAVPSLGAVTVRSAGLPAATAEVGELFQDSLRRRVREETGLDVTVERVVEAALDVVVYACR
jgi:hypothetical protein